MENDALKLLKQLLDIPSVNGTDNEKNMAEYLAEYFHKHYIDAKIQYIDDNHANVIAFLPGQNSDKTVIWNGHLDTVPYGNLDEWKTNPSAAVVNDGKVYARGASDMKSGLAAMVYAMCHSAERPAYNIQFIGTCDEERNGIGAEKIVESGILSGAEYMLIGEPTGLKPGVAQKGCLWLEMNISGKTSHGAYPSEGVSAIHNGVSIAEEICSFVNNYKHNILGISTAQITMIEGGVAPNMTADECRVVMDIRMVPGLTSDTVIKYAKDILTQKKEAEPELDIEFCSLNDRRAIEIDSNDKMVSELREIARRYGYAEGDTGVNFFTDASILDRYDEKKILLFGPGEPSMAHQSNEYVSIRKYEDAIQILSELMMSCSF